MIERLLAHIRLVLTDFDGVLTDNRVLVDSNGVESVVCSRADGWGVARLTEAGVLVIVVSSETNAVVARRCEKLGVRCVHGVSDKGVVVADLIRSSGVAPGMALFIGNDLNDLAAFAEVGVRVAPRDAHHLVREQADIITEQRGGDGVLREVAELIVDCKQGGREWD